VSIRPNRRQLLKSAVLAVGGRRSGGNGHCAGRRRLRRGDPRGTLGVVTGAQDSQGTVEVGLDDVAGAKLTKRGRTRLLHRHCIQAMLLRLRKTQPEGR